MNRETSAHHSEFQPVEIDEIDAKLNETARSKGIPTLSFPDPAPTDEQLKPEISTAKPRRKTLSTEIPALDSSQRPCGSGNGVRAPYRTQCSQTARFRYRRRRVDRRWPKTTVEEMQLNTTNQSEGASEALPRL